jgi:hypothetical protein
MIIAALLRRQILCQSASDVITMIPDQSIRRNDLNEAENVRNLAAPTIGIRQPTERQCNDALCL